MIAETRHDLLVMLGGFLMGLGAGGLLLKLIGC